MTPNQQLAAYARNAGFTGDDIAIAVAIALAESGGRLDAYNPETAAGTPEGMGSFGLWQIYLYKHPEFNGLDLTDPQQNANAAFMVYSNAGNSFRPWSTFNTYLNGKFISSGTGAYLKKMPAALLAVNA